MIVKNTNLELDKPANVCQCYFDRNTKIYKSTAKRPDDRSGF